MALSRDIARRQRRAARMAVSVALALGVAKLATGLFVNSVSVMASAMDSFLDVLASWLNLVAIRVSHAPPDREHRFGHQKAEALATAGQSLLIGGSGVYLLIEGARRIVAPEPFRRPWIALGVMAAASLTSALLVAYMKRTARDTRSSALQADATHYTTDVLANLAVLVGFGIASITGLRFLDGVLTVAVAFYVGTSAYQLLRGATRVLMDEEIPPADRARLIEVIKPFVGRTPRGSQPGSANGAPDSGTLRSFHGLRTRSAGKHVFIELHLEMDGEIPLQHAHDLGVEVENAIQASFPDAQVLIHLDVEDDEPPLTEVAGKS